MMHQHQTQMWLPISFDARLLENIARSLEHGACTEKQMFASSSLLWTSVQPFQLELLIVPSCKWHSLGGKGRGLPMLLVGPAANFWNQWLTATSEGPAASHGSRHISTPPSAQSSHNVQHVEAEATVLLTCRRLLVPN
mmetsp:Transcript_153641/g.492467  ORF Transcript_153641/g.492467 Transcript_153641/m.492467 type:complete len:138 (+) Transcript_153641:61-474(+)